MQHVELGIDVLGDRADRRRSRLRGRRRHCRWYRQDPVFRILGVILNQPGGTATSAASGLVKCARDKGPSEATASVGLFY